MSEDVKPVADAPVAPAVEPVAPVAPVVEADEVEDGEDESDAVEGDVKWEDGRPVFPENDGDGEEE